MMVAAPAVRQTEECRCGSVVIALNGPPILGAICYCDSCRTAGTAFAAAEGADPTLQADGGTDYCLYRKDDFTIFQGGHLLREERLKPTSATRRVVASCCNSPMFLEFVNGHWVTVYRRRLKNAEAPAQMRVMVKDLPAPLPRTDDIPAYPTQPPRFMMKLLGAWAAMRFRRPKIDW